jgi:YHS domain-containing protein
MPLLSLLLRAAALLLVLRLAGRFLAGLLSGLRPAPPRRDLPDQLVRDRVCNTYVLKARALHATIDGEERHFCSPACRDQALRRSA